MTGYGKSLVKLNSHDVTIEIKTLNSKQLDISTRIPSIYSGLESKIRSAIADRVIRGKVEFTLSIDGGGKQKNSVSINVPVMKKYKEKIEEAATELGLDTPNDWFQFLIKLPDVMTTDTTELTEDDTNIILEGVAQTLYSLLKFRKQDGAMLEKLFQNKITNIANLLSEVEPFETERIVKIKQRLKDGLEKLKISDYDNNRFEQELIFYIEKLDINEEKQRLDNHLKYFIETMEGEYGQGKKLGFIVQEMGREINTLGSKSNNAEMQRIVVQMKDELEQIKEQILNVL